MIYNNIENAISELERKIQNVYGSSEVVKQIEDIISENKYKIWKIHKNRLLTIIDRGITWCEVNIQQFDFSFINTIHINFIELKVKYIDLKFKIDSTGKNQEEVKKKEEKYLKLKLSILEFDYAVRKELGFSNGQLSIFYYPKIIDLALKIQNRFGGFEQKINDLRNELVLTQTNVEGQWISKTVVMSEEEIDSFLITFQGTLEEQFKQLSKIELPNLQASLDELDNHLTEMVGQNKDNKRIDKLTLFLGMKGHITSLIYKDNMYKERIVIGKLSGENVKIYHAKEDMKFYHYEKLALKIQKLFDKWMKFSEFKDEFISYFTNSWIYPFRIPFIEKFIEYFLKDDKIGSIYIMIPQIEGLLRDLIHSSGKSIYKENRKNSEIQEYILAGDILQKLRDYNLISENLILCMEVFLFNPLHFNLRHDTLHGFKEISQFSDFDCYILLLILFQITNTITKE